MKKKNSWPNRAALSGAILGVLGSAQAATIDVDGPCSLIDAIQAANTDAAVGSCTAGSGDDIINVVTTDSGINITTQFGPSSYDSGYVGLPVISSNITIEGNGLTLSANGASDAFRMLEVDSGGDLTLRDTTVTGVDNGSGTGSGLLSYGGRVTIENSTFALNNGAVFMANSYGNVISNSIIRHNRNSSGFAAGLQGVFAGIDISNTSIVDNTHDYSGFIRGGFLIAGGVGLLQSDVSISDSTISGNRSIYGAGFFVVDDNPIPLPSKINRFDDSPMRGIILSDLTLTNSTITDNTSYLAAGILDVTDYGTITLQGTIVAGNNGYTNNGIPNIYSTGDSTFNLGNYNIIGDNGSTGSLNITLGAGDQSFANDTKDNLYPLTLSQGQLMHPLKEGSVAIDGNDISCFGSINDQEGKGRGIDGDDNGSFICDIGSFEHSLPIIADGSPCTFDDAVASAENDTSVNGCRPGNGHDIIQLPESSTVTFSNFVDNYAAGVYYAFGSPAINSAVTIEANDSTFERDAAATEDFDLLLVAEGGQLNLINANVTGANGGLGAVSSWFGGNLNIIDSNVSYNQSAGIFDIASINSSVVNTTVANNTPIGPYSAGYAFSPLSTLQSVGFELSNSTISSNIGGTGGGVDFRNVTLASMQNSTISGNTSVYAGGLIITPNYNNFQVADIDSATITNNAGAFVGGILGNASSAEGNIELSHSIVSGNQVTPPAPRNLSPSTLSAEQHPLLSQNLVGQVNNPTLGGPTTPTEIGSNGSYFEVDSFNIIGQNGDPGTYNVTPGYSDIVPAGATSTVISTNLADNGGDTLTHLPVDDGVAVDGGASNCELIEDQRGFIRPWDGDNDGGDNCDIGAVEFGSISSSDIIFKDGFDPLIIIRRTPTDN
ncbi:hypothetical protein OS175_07200 [Marinicella sp. S1101]|uniref:choice-of-anchor Q domain-containing protein n=1 Tax=Marinicella marina TaxID=2996016 RepID=UPI002260B50B|nr:choice-of-anchor Q domain-containing protein [Marinicella marina]MCX7553660.1 hypothetical protein [Marinicella marina]MDJ1140284.1 choice-of-anchor Q domain-containing protein [Marinicella marina]